MFLPRVVLFRVVIHNVMLLKQKMFLGVSSVVRMTTRPWGGGNPIYL